MMNENLSISVEKLQLIYKEFIVPLTSTEDIEEFLFVFLNYVNNPLGRSEFNKIFKNSVIKSTPIQYEEFTSILRDTLNPSKFTLITENNEEESRLVKLEEKTF